MVCISLQHIPDLHVVHWAACLCGRVGFDACQLLGAAMSSVPAVLDLAWFGSQCWVTYTRISSGMAVSIVQPVTSCMLCIHSATSFTAALLALRVLDLTDFCCISVAVARPVLYRFPQCCWLSFGVEEVLVLVAHVLESCLLMLTGQPMGLAWRESAWQTGVVVSNADSLLLPHLCQIGHSCLWCMQSVVVFHR